MMQAQPEVPWWRHAIWTVPAITGVGFLAGRLSGSGYGNPWFDALTKPVFMPPGWLFGLAWTALYVMLGLAAALILALPRSEKRGQALTVFWAQMLLNFCWTPVFFAAHDIRLATIVLVAIVLMSAAAAGKFWRLRPLAGGLMIPYLGWLTFATVLNNAIDTLNPAAGENLLAKLAGG